ncbi:MAG: response regulator [Bryobacteraceae bacterium]
MSRILLADDSPHAQRMGERILREEGFEVVTVTDGNTALVRLADVDPDLVLADVSLPSRSGYDICQEVKKQLRHSHVRVILTAGLLEPFDEAQAALVRCDGILKKPFESSVVLEMVRPLIAAATAAKAERNVPAELLPAAPAKQLPPMPVLPTPAVAVPVRVVAEPMEAIAPPADVSLETERVRAAVTLALEASLPKMIDEITERVLVALGH